MVRMGCERSGGQREEDGDDRDGEMTDDRRDRKAWNMKRMMSVSEGGGRD